MLLVANCGMALQESEIQYCGPPCLLYNSVKPLNKVKMCETQDCSELEAGLFSWSKLSLFVESLSSLSMKHPIAYSSIWWFFLLYLSHPVWRHCFATHSTTFSHLRLSHSIQNTYEGLTMTMRLLQPIAPPSTIKLVLCSHSLFTDLKHYVWILLMMRAETHCISIKSLVYIPEHVHTCVGV